MGIGDAVYEHLYLVGVVNHRQNNRFRAAAVLTIFYTASSMAKKQGRSTRLFDQRTVTFAAMLAVMNRSIHAAAFLGIHHRHQHHAIMTSARIRHPRRPNHNNIMALLTRSKTRRHSSTKYTNVRFMSSTNDYFLNLRIPTPEDMEDIGGLLSVSTTVGDIIFLDGDLGAGKTCFSRGFVRGRTGIPNERVTSPTYLLSNTYPITDDDNCKRGTRIMIHHMDLYRLSGSEDDLAPLNLEHVFAHGISLVEWPSRLNWKPSTRLDVTLTISNSTSQAGDQIITGDDTKDRFMKLVPHGDRWVERLKFLSSEGYFEDLIVGSSINR